MENQASGVSTGASAPEGVRMAILRRGLLAVASAVVASRARAQDAWPTRPVRIVVPFAPGGAIDLAGRIMADALAKAFNQGFVVENRGGAGGIPAMLNVTRAPADGYTLAVASGGPLTVSPTLFRNSGFDPLAEIEPVIIFANTPIVLIARKDLPAGNLGELAALSRSTPGGLTMAGGSPGGSVPQLAAEFLQERLGVRWVSVPYRGSPPALADLTAGRVDVMVDAVPAPAPLVLGGAIKAFAVTTARRAHQLPQVPTMQELGFADFDIGSWMGLAVRRGTPPEIVVALHRVLAAALETPEVRGRLEGAGALPEGGPPERMTRLIEADLPRWARVIEATGLTPERL
jgi:tripartite-type tricarboxylate transporter receptor subunit TctC